MVSSFFLNFFSSARVGVWVWGLGCGSVGVERRDRDGAGWMEGGGGGVGCGGGVEGGGMGIWLGGSLDGTANRAPRASPSRIRIAGSGVIDRPTFRIPGSQMRAFGLGEVPHSPQDGRNASRSS